MKKLTKEQLEAAAERLDPITLTNIEIERIWKDAINTSHWETEKLSYELNKAYLDHLTDVCYTNYKKDKEKALKNLNSVQSLDAYMKRFADKNIVIDFQASVIKSTQLDLIKSEIKRIQMSEEYENKIHLKELEIKNLKKNIK